MSHFAIGLTSMGAQGVRVTTDRSLDEMDAVLTVTGIDGMLGDTGVFVQVRDEAEAEWLLQLVNAASMPVIHSSLCEARVCDSSDAIDKIITLRNRLLRAAEILED